MPLPLRLHRCQLLLVVEPAPRVQIEAVLLSEEDRWLRLRLRQALLFKIEKPLRFALVLTEPPEGHHRHFFLRLRPLLLVLVGSPPELFLLQQKLFHGLVLALDLHRHLLHPFNFLLPLVLRVRLSALPRRPSGQRFLVGVALYGFSGGPAVLLCVLEQCLDECEIAL